MAQKKGLVAFMDEPRGGYNSSLRVRPGAKDVHTGPHSAGPPFQDGLNCIRFAGEVKGLSARIIE